MTKDLKNRVLNAAARRQPADYASNIEILGSTAKLRSAAPKTQREKERGPDLGIMHRCDQPQPTHQQRHARRSNPHRWRIHNTASHRLRGFLLWALSVASC